MTLALWMVARLAETMAGQTAVSSVHLRAGQVAASMVGLRVEPKVKSTDQKTAGYLDHK